jgi:hypothetical protein
LGIFTGTPVSSTNKTDHHDITEILLKVALNTIALKIYKGFVDCKQYKLLLILDEVFTMFIMLYYPLFCVE